MNAIMDLIKDDVLFVVDLVLPMLIIAKNAPFKKKIEMDAQKLSTWDRQRLICFMNARNTDSKSDIDFIYSP